MTSCAVTIQKTLFSSRTSPWCYLFLTFTTTSLKLFFNFDIWQSWEWLPSFIWFYTHRVPVKNQYTVSNHRQSLALSDQSNENIEDSFFFFFLIAFAFTSILTVALTLMASASEGVGVMSNASVRGAKSGMDAGPLDKLLEFINEL